MKNSAIEWCDHTFNPWIGCTKVSPGCANCYAEARDLRFAEGVHWGNGAPRQRTSVDNWKQPLLWAKAAERALAEHGEACGIDPAYGMHVKPPARPRVFCASLADWLDDEVPVEWLADLLDLIRSTPQLDWLLLTKRPENFQRRLKAVDLFWGGSCLARRCLPPANVWVGVTVENQAMADERIPELLSIPAKVWFLSCEPLLGPVDLRSASGGAAISVRIDWLICGGESGSKARPMHPDWARALRDQCAAAGVAFFFKQWGEWTAIDQPDLQADPAPRGKNERWMNVEGGHGYHGEEVWRMRKVGKHDAGRLLDGIEHNQFPEVSR